MAGRYCKRGTLDPRGTLRRPVTEHLADLLITEHDALYKPDVLMLRLDSLSLSGFDLAVIVRGLPAPLIDFNNLSTLIIQSCSGLDEALSMLMGPNVTRRETMGALQLRTLIIRHENADSVFMRSLNEILVSLRPLTTLHVLLKVTPTLIF